MQQLNRRAPVSAGGRGRLVAFAAAGKGFGSKRPAPPPKHTTQQTPLEACPCGSGKAYKNCCEPYHKGPAAAPSIEATLRARFSAYAKGGSDYLASTTHPDYHVFHYNVAQPGGAEEKLKQDIAAACNRFVFTGLKVVQLEPGQSEGEGFVSFEYLSRRKFNEQGVPLSDEELSDTSKWDKTAEKCRFYKSGDVWQFVDYQRASFSGDMMAGSTPAA